LKPFLCINIIRENILKIKIHDMSLLKLPPTLTAWRCGSILCSFCPQLKPIKDISLMVSTAAKFITSSWDYR